MTITTRRPGSLKARLAVLGLALSLVLGAAAPAALGVGTSTGIAGERGPDVAFVMKVNKASPILM